MSTQCFKPKDVSSSTWCFSCLSTSRRYECVKMYMHSHTLNDCIAVQSANCSSGELRIRNESNGVRGRLQFCDNKVWFSFVWNSYYWDSTQWNSGLACSSLGYSGLGEQNLAHIIQNLLWELVLVAESTSYRINFLDQAYIPLFPLDITCSSNSRSFSLTDCSSRYHSSEYTASTLYEVGIECRRQGGLATIYHHVHEQYLLLPQVQYVIMKFGLMVRTTSSLAELRSVSMEHGISFVAGFGMTMMPV